MKITVEVVEAEVENEFGAEVAGLKIICSRCGHEVEVFGRSDRSIKRGCIRLRDDCQKNERHFYEASAETLRAYRVQF